MILPSRSRRAALLALSLAAAATAVPAQAEITAPAAVQALPSGAHYERIVRGGEAPMVAHVVALDLTQPGLRFALTPGDRSRGMEYVARTTSAFLAESGADIAINASYFLPFAGGSPKGDDYYPKAGQPASASGAVIAGGRRVSPVEDDLDLRVNAMLCFQRAEARIVDGQVCPKDTSDGVAAGPRILAGGEQSDFMPFDNNAAQTRQPRTAFGLSADRRKAWIIVVDGRQAGHSLGASLPELAELFRSLGASDAINLDGGGSTTLAVRGTDGSPAVLNSPIHTGVPGRERPVANHIGIFLSAGDAR